MKTVDDIGKAGMLALKFSQITKNDWRAMIIGDSFISFDKGIRQQIHLTPRSVILYYTIGQSATICRVPDISPTMNNIEDWNKLIESLKDSQVVVSLKCFKP